MSSEGLWKSLRLQGKFLEDLHEVLHHSLILSVKAAPKLRLKKSQLPFLDSVFSLGPNKTINKEILIPFPYGSLLIGFLTNCGLSQSAVNCYILQFPIVITKPGRW